jgi:hypothetical protein
MHVLRTVILERPVGDRPVSTFPLIAITGALAEEKAALIPTRTAIVERLHQRE